MLASKDPLTGFLNRRSLAEEGAAMLVRADRRHKAMALIDILDCTMGDLIEPVAAARPRMV